MLLEMSNIPLLYTNECCEELSGGAWLSRQKKAEESRSREQKGAQSFQGYFPCQGEVKGHFLIMPATMTYEGILVLFLLGREINNLVSSW